MGRGGKGSMLVLGLLACQVALIAKAADPIVAVDTKAVPPLAYDAGEVRIIATSDTTGSRAGVVELTELPGYETPWHQHDGCDEAFYVLEGTLTFRMGT